MSDLSKLIQSILHGNYDELALTEFVTLAQKISLSYLMYQQEKQKLPKGLGELEDLALDCIAGLFVRNEKGEFTIFKKYFVSHRLEDLSDAETLVLFRRLILTKTKQEISTIFKKPDVKAKFSKPSTGETATQSKSEIGQSSEFAFDFYIDPGGASGHDIAEFYDALSELHRSCGGIGVTIADITSKLHETERVI